MIKKIFSGARRLLYYIIANTIGRLIYPRKIFTGKHFKNIFNDGWKWICGGIFYQKILGYNRHIRFPVNFRTIISSNNIEFDSNDLNNFQHFGCYFQNFNGKIKIGKGTFIAPNVGIITSNHDINDLSKHQNGKDVVINEDCWIGMNSVILPGVILGKHTIVGAGSVVTKSFDGNCVIAGNPAKKIKDLERKIDDEN